VGGSGGSVLGDGGSAVAAGIPRSPYGVTPDQATALAVPSTRAMATHHRRALRDRDGRKGATSGASSSSDLALMASVSSEGAVGTVFSGGTPSASMN
jgi:hypothetical protein